MFLIIPVVNGSIKNYAGIWNNVLIVVFPDFYFQKGWYRNIQGQYCFIGKTVF